MDSDFERWMVLQALPQVGPKRLARLRSLNPPWPEGWLPGLPPMAAAALRLWLEHPRRSPLTAPVEEALEWQAQGVAHGQQRHLLHPGHPRWPALLDQIADPPVVLWALGDLDGADPTAAGPGGVAASYPGRPGQCTQFRHQPGGSGMVPGQWYGAGN